MNSDPAALPGTLPTAVPPPVACPRLMFPAQMPRWLAVATAPARPPDSCRHGGLPQARASPSPPWPQKLLAHPKGQ